MVIVPVSFRIDRENALAPAIDQDSYPVAQAIAPALEIDRASYRVVPARDGRPGTVRTDFPTPVCGSRIASPGQIRSG